MYTHNQVGGARMWFPCMDNFADRCPFEMEFTVHSNLVVVSSGELVKQILSEDHTKKTFYYKLDIPTAAHAIGVAVGPFEILPGVDTQPNSKFKNILTHFCLPNRKKDLENTTSFLAQVRYP